MDYLRPSCCEVTCARAKPVHLLSTYSVGLPPSTTTGLPSSSCVVGCVFIMAVTAYQTSKTKAEI